MIPTHARHAAFPRVAARRLGAAADREAARAAAAARAHPRADPRPGPRAPRPVQHHRARARPRGARSGSRCTAPTRKHFPLGTKTGCRRLFAEEGVPHPVGRRGAHVRRRTPSARSSRMRARSGRTIDAGAREAERGRLGRGERGGRARRPAGAGRRGRARGAIEERIRAHVASRATRLTSTRTSRKLRRARRRRRGADHRRRSSEARASSCASRRSARSSCSRRTTSCSAGRAARAISAAGSRPTPSTRRRSRAEAAKIGEASRRAKA